MLIPNNKQKTKLFQYANTARFAYNWALGREQENYKNGGKFISDGDLRKEFTQLKKTDEYSWLNNVSNNVTKQAIKDACEAYRDFFKGYTKFPRFKSKKYSVPKFYQDNVKIQFTDTHVKVEGFANYELVHELYAITLLFTYILTGKNNWARITNPDIRTFMEKGTNPDKTKRYQTLDELSEAVKKCISSLEK